MLESTTVVNPVHSKHDLATANAFEAKSAASNYSRKDLVKKNSSGLRGKLRHMLSDMTTFCSSSEALPQVSGGMSTHARLKRRFSELSKVAEQLLEHFDPNDPYRKGMEWLLRLFYLGFVGSLNCLKVWKKLTSSFRMSDGKSDSLKEAMKSNRKQRDTLKKRAKAFVTVISRPRAKVADVSRCVSDLVDLMGKFESTAYSSPLECVRLTATAAKEFVLQLAYVGCRLFEMRTMLLEVDDQLKRIVGSATASIVGDEIFNMKNEGDLQRTMHGLVLQLTTVADSCVNLLIPHSLNIVVNPFYLIRDACKRISTIGEAVVSCGFVVTQMNRLIFSHFLDTSEQDAYTAEQLVELYGTKVLLHVKQALSSFQAVTSFSLMEQPIDATKFVRHLAPNSSRASNKLDVLRDSIIGFQEHLRLRSVSFEDSSAHFPEMLDHLLKELLKGGICLLSQELNVKLEKSTSVTERMKQGKMSLFEIEETKEEKGVSPGGDEEKADSGDGANEGDVDGPIGPKSEVLFQTVTPNWDAIHLYDMRNFDSFFRIFMNEVKAEEEMATSVSHSESKRQFEAYRVMYIMLNAGLTEVGTLLSLLFDTSPKILSVATLLHGQQDRLLKGFELFINPIGNVRGNILTALQRLYDLEEHSVLPELVKAMWIQCSSVGIMANAPQSKYEAKMPLDGYSTMIHARIILTDLPQWQYLSNQIIEMRNCVREKELRILKKELKKGWSIYNTEIESANENYTQETKEYQKAYDNVVELTQSIVDACVAVVIAQTQHKMQAGDGGLQEFFDILRLHALPTPNPTKVIEKSFKSIDDYYVEATVSFCKWDSPVNTVVINGKELTRENKSCLLFASGTIQIFAKTTNCYVYTSKHPLINQKTLDM